MEVLKFTAFKNVMVYRLTSNHLILPLLQGSSYTPSKLPPEPLELWAYEVSRGPIIFEICRLMHMASCGGAKLRCKALISWPCLVYCEISS